MSLNPVNTNSNSFINPQTPSHLYSNSNTFNFTRGNSIPSSLPFDQLKAKGVSNMNPTTYDEVNLYKSLSSSIKLESAYQKLNNSYSSTVPPNYYNPQFPQLENQFNSQFETNSISTTTPNSLMYNSFNPFYDPIIFDEDPPYELPELEFPATNSNSNWQTRQNSIDPFNFSPFSLPTPLQSPITPCASIPSIDISQVEPEKEFQQTNSIKVQPISSSLTSLNAPIELRNYITSSRTSRKRKATSKKVDEDEYTEEGDEGELNLNGLKAIERKRILNTVSIVPFPLLTYPKPLLTKILISTEPENQEPESKKD